MMLDTIRCSGPVASIVIPAYNCEPTLAVAVRSCLEQTHESLEVIVVNDGSNDGTADVLASFGSDIEVITQPNGGLAAARNAGIRAARGKFIAWMDADDIAHPERTALQVQALLSEPQLALVSSDFSAFTDEAEDFETSHIERYYEAYERLGGAAKIYARAKALGSGQTLYWGHVYEHLIWGNFVHPPTVMARRTALQQVGVLDETLRYSCDYDLLIRLSRYGEFGFIDTPLLRYRRSSTQMSGPASHSKMPLETARILEKVRGEDPALYARRRQLFHLRTAESLITAAAAIGPHARGTALSLLWNGLRHKLLFTHSIYALTRILMPDAIRRYALRVWRGGASRAVGACSAIFEMWPQLSEDSVAACVLFA